MWVQVWRSLEQVPPSWRRSRAAAAVGKDFDPDGAGGSVVTFGTFDGLHRGHRSVLDVVVARARALALPCVAVTFDRHPLSVLSPGSAPVPVITPRTRVRLLGEAGMDAVLELPFTAELAAMDARRFVEEVLVETLGAREVVVGDDARFGKAGEGDLAMLTELGATLGVGVTGVDAVAGRTHSTGVVVGSGPDSSRRWSSTWVREAIAQGDVQEAAAVLGRWHRTVGTVVHGDHRGRELGYPTANLDDIEVAVPADGVYAGWLERLDPPEGTPAEERVLPCAISIGTNPTFDGQHRQVEAHVLGRLDLDLYGERVALDYVERLRPTLRFDGVDELVEQMHADTARCAVVLSAARL